MKAPNYLVQKLVTYQLNNMNIQNLTGNDDSELNFVIDIKSEATIKLENVYVSQIDISKYQSFFTLESLGSANISLSNITFDSVSFPTPLLNFGSIANVDMVDLKFTKVQRQTSNDVSNSMIDLTSIPSLIDRNITVSGISVEYSSMSLMKLNNVAQTSTIDQHILITNVSYVHCVLEFKDDLINFGNIVSNDTYMMTIDQLEFHNITFIRGGHLISFQHQTDDALIVNNTNISNITFGSFYVKSFDLTGNAVDTKIKFDNMHAQSIDGQYASLIVLEEIAKIEICNSSFSFISNIIGGSVLQAGYRSAVADIYDSVFYNNTSTEGGVFISQSESVIRLHNCTLTNNFAVGSGVIKAESNGYYEIYNSYISNNYGLYAAVSEIYSTDIESVISNSTITSNIALTSDYIRNEFLNQGKLEDHKLT